MKSGMTGERPVQDRRRAMPQWSPLMKSGMTRQDPRRVGAVGEAAMEPAHEERDDKVKPRLERWRDVLPQWSPLMKSGMTGIEPLRRRDRVNAAMEPAHEERDDDPRARRRLPARLAAMEPAHEERDDWALALACWLRAVLPQWSPLMKSGMTWRVITADIWQVLGRNGARS